MYLQLFMDIIIEIGYEKQKACSSFNCNLISPYSVFSDIYVWGGFRRRFERTKPPTSGRTICNYHYSHLEMAVWKEGLTHIKPQRIFVIWFSMIVIN